VSRGMGGGSTAGAVGVGAAVAGGGAGWSTSIGALLVTTVPWLLPAACTAVPVLAMCCAARLGVAGQPAAAAAAAAA
jgi:hypothetical protein